jgi:hypothetical protein
VLETKGKGVPKLKRRKSFFDFCIKRKAFNLRWGVKPDYLSFCILQTFTVYIYSLGT